MKQKPALARALVHEPRSSPFDEPTSGLDPQVTQSVRELILQFKGEGRTILLCTHNLDEAERFMTGSLYSRLVPSQSINRKRFGIAYSDDEW